MASEAPRSLDLAGVIDAHIMCTAMDGSGVVLTMGDRRVIGRFDMPDASGSVVFVPEEVSATEALPRVRGSQVRLEYWSRGVTCSFDCRIHSFTRGGRVRLHRPDVVRRTDRRLVQRWSVTGGSSFRLRVRDGQQHADFDLIDLSNAGLSFRYHPDALRVARGDALEVLIDLPNRHQVRAQVCIRHISQRDDGSRVAGAHLERIRPPDREALTEALAAHAQAFGGRRAAG